MKYLTKTRVLIALSLLPKDLRRLVHQAVRNQIIADGIVSHAQAQAEGNISAEDQAQKLLSDLGVIIRSKE